MNSIVNWLTEQQQNQQAIYLMLDPLAEPNPVATLLTNQAIMGYTWLLHNTPYESLRYASPTIIQIADINNQGVQELINHPEQDWGWFFTTSRQVTMEQLIAHWQARLTLIYEQQEVFYRFQDNRVIIRALKGIPKDQYFQLLGQTNQVALWHENEWQIYTNETPREYILTTKENLIWALPEPAKVTHQVLFNNLHDWLMNTFSLDTLTQSAIEPNIPDWLEAQITLAETYQWHTQSQCQYLIEQKLIAEQAHSEQWQPLDGETPETHYQRMQSLFNKVLPKKALTPILDTDKLENHS